MNTLDLNGTWKLRWADGTRGKKEYANLDVVDDARYIDAIVPGEVHLDCWRAGWIQDPYIGTNCLAARWVEECIWSYRREFDAPTETTSAGGRSWLVFDSLDLAATIVLNGKEIGKHANVFYPCRIDVTGMLRPGKNILAVHLDAGLYHGAEKSAQANWNPGEDLTRRVWLRKPQCQFGWDWSTRLINVGIGKRVRLEWTEAPIRADQFVPLVDVTADLKTATVRARLFIEGLQQPDAAPIKAKLSADIRGTDAKASAEIEIKAGLHPYEVTLTVNNPKLWWPVGHGEPILHDLNLSLEMGGKSIAQRSARIGFRHVRINQDPHPQSGQYFTLEINGRKIFAKGGNFVPADMIFARIDRQRYDRLTDLALEANCNFLRVWGGGLYESNDFYELCDEKGILVWQEFIFACNRYPSTDAAFTESVRREAAYNVRRLAAHASLVVWCGNNEMEEAAWHWGYDKTGLIVPDHALFHLILPRILAQEDPTRPYFPSSPYSPNGLDPRRDDIGDQHPWTIGFQNTDFREYRKMICRFPNEGGILGATSLPTMLACLPEGPQRKVQSFAWQVHDNSVDSWAETSPPDDMIRQWLGKEPRDMSVEEFTYWAGLVQGEGLREYIDNFHRRMFDTSSAIFWMYNDTWPAVRSWTIVDYSLRRTPSFAPVKRAMAPINVVVAQENDEIVVFGINETRETISCDVRFGVFSLAGGCPIDKHQSAELKPNASTRLASFPASQWTNPDASAAFAILSNGQRVIARNRLFIPRFKDLKWPPASVRVKLRDGQAVFECDTFAWGICLDLNGETPIADNFFDVYPGIPHAIAWKESTPPKILHVGNLRGG